MGAGFGKVNTGDRGRGVEGKAGDGKREECVGDGGQISAYIVVMKEVMTGAVGAGGRLYAQTKASKFVGTRVAAAFQRLALACKGMKERRDEVPPKGRMHGRKSWDNGCFSRSKGRAGTDTESRG